MDSAAIGMGTIDVTSSTPGWPPHSNPTIVTASAHQIHGAIGFTKEHDIHLFFRYAKASEIAFGDASFHKKVVGEEMDE
jgi:hypothetical protein